MFKAKIGLTIGTLNALFAFMAYYIFVSDVEYLLKTSVFVLLAAFFMCINYIRLDHELGLRKTVAGGVDILNQVMIRISGLLAAYYTFHQWEIMNNGLIELLFTLIVIVAFGSLLLGTASRVALKAWLDPTERIIQKGIDEAEQDKSERERDRKQRIKCMVQSHQHDPWLTETRYDPTKGQVVSKISPPKWKRKYARCITWLVNHKLLPEGAYIWLANKAGYTAKD